jgi:FkbM family methyltransferase
MGIMTKEYFINPELTTEEVKKLAGSYTPESFYNLIIDHDCDVYWNDNGVKKLLFHFRKGVIPNEMMENSIKVFKKEALKASSLRGVAGGAAEPDKISPNVDHVVSAGKFKSRVAFKDGTISDYYVSNKVQSIIAGYFDKPKVSDKHEVIVNGTIPCRTTMFTEKNFAAWETVLPLLTLVDKYYKEMQPDTHLKQYSLSSKTPEFQIADTAFSTLTVNLNWRTACHIDGGDFKNGYSVIMVAEEGKWKGSYLGYPRFKVCIDVRQGDFLLMDPHQYHANTEITPLTLNYTRLSFVVYYRENMQKCEGFTKTKKKITITKKQVKDTPVPVIQAAAVSHSQSIKQLPLLKDINGEFMHVKYDKKNIDLFVFVRPDTTDIKVIKEVLSDNVYEKAKINFTVEKTDNWLDLGGNIGTFALLALSRGAKVTTCEPEPDNLKILNANLNRNFKGKDWSIIDAAITIENSTEIDLYICKGDYNKYRHTVHAKRGRATLKVQNINIHDLLKQKKFNAIKMDIEGAEIEILEHLKAEDYAKYNIQKLTFEYSFDVDDSIPRFMAIIRKLEKAFKTVHYTKVKPEELRYTYFPAATMVHCI